MFARRDVLAGGGAVAVVALGGCGGNKSGAPAAGAAAPGIVVPYTMPAGLKLSGDDYIDQLGRGADSVSDELLGHNIIGERVDTPVSPDERYRSNTLRYEMYESQSQYRSEMRKTAKAQARFKLFSGSASASRSSEEAKDSYSLRVCAVAKKHDHATMFRGGTAKLEPALNRRVQNGRRQPDPLLAQFGDSYVAAVTPSSQLIIEIVIGTRSEANRNDVRGRVKASLAGLGRARGNLSGLITSASSAKSLSVRIAGIAGNFDWQRVATGDVEELLNSFFGPAERPRFAELEYRPYVTLPTREPLAWSNPIHILKREQFATRAAEILELIDDSVVDAAYVGDNPGEFDADTRAQAAEDLPMLIAAWSRVADLAKLTFAEFRRSGATGPAFDRGRLDALLPVRRSYLQMEPVPVPPPPPRPAPRRETDRGRNDHGGHGGGKALESGSLMGIRT